MKKIVFTENAPAPIGPYSQAVLVNNTLYCSGQIAADCLSGDISEQTDKVCKNICAVLAAADMSIQNVVKTTCFLADMADFLQFNNVYQQYFNHRPARSCIAAKELPKGTLVEIEVVAVEG
jgi:2-iminobutanoate/2-iminopropanoate deaminase